MLTGHNTISTVRVRALETAYNSVSRRHPALRRSTLGRFRADPDDAADVDGQSGEYQNRVPARQRRPDPLTHDRPTVSWSSIVSFGSASVASPCAGVPPAGCVLPHRAVSRRATGSV